MARRFARVAPSKFDREVLVDIRVTDMNAGDARWWDRRLGPRHAGNGARADRFWVWSVLLPMCHLVQRAKRRQCRPLVIWARTDSGRFLRAGMSILIEDYPYLDAQREVESHFVWFISAADPNVLRDDFGVTHPPALGRVLLDTAMVLSQNAAFEGRIGLHAAVAGGPGLLKVYERCGLLVLAADAPMPGSVTRVNDGRFFYADEAVAESLTAALDASR